MATELEELKVLQAAEDIADRVWDQVSGWKDFARDTIGKQVVRAADSVGANIAESFGRFHYGEKIEFLYYARGSLFETKYWLNRAAKRKLILMPDAQQYADQLTALARQLNTFASSLKSQRRANQSTKVARESSTAYETQTQDEFDSSLFTEDNFRWLQSFSNNNFPVSNLQSPASTHQYHISKTKRSKR